MSLQTPSTVEIDRVPIDALRETEGPRIEQTDLDHVDKLARSIEHEGQLQAITVTPSEQSGFSFDIVDGRHRKRALEKLGVEEVDVYDMPGERSWVVPSEEAEAEIGIQSMAANALQKSLTQAERGRFLMQELQQKLIKEMSQENKEKLNMGNESPANVRGQNTVPPARQILYHLDEIDEQKDDWKFADELFERLKRIRFALDIGDPRTEAEYLQFYNESPERVVAAWEREDIGKSAVEHLRQIEQDDLREFALEEASRDGDERYSVRDLGKVRNAAKHDINSVNEKIINEEFDDLQEAVDLAEEKAEKEPEEEQKEPEDGPDEDELEQFIEEEVSTEDQQRINKVADHLDSPEDKVLRECYQQHTEGEDYQTKLKEAVEDINELLNELKQRHQERKQQLEEFEFETDSQFAAGNAEHLAPPIETDNLGIFFHDCLEMDDEIEDDSVQLVFTSPPYFTQRGNIVEKWWPEDPTWNEENADAAYQNYLEEMMDVFAECCTKLAEGGHLMLNLSDYNVKSLKLYDIPSDVSYLLRNQSELDLHYISTITWDKQSDTSSRLASFRTSNNIADFSPAWQTERILVFRKGSKRKKQDYEINRNDLKSSYENFNPFADLWRAKPTKRNEAEHHAGFPLRLPSLAVKLFTYPGDTIIDPFGGYATTLQAIKEINEETSAPPRKGFAWEDFSSETADHRDFREQAKHRLGMGTLADFTI